MAAVFKMPVLLTQAKKRYMAKNADFEQTIIDSYMKSQQLTQALIGVARAVIEIGAAIIGTAVGGPAGLAIATAGIASSGYDATTAISDYRDNKSTFGLGLNTNEPSPAWVIVAVAATVLDIGAARDAVKVMRQFDAGQIESATALRGRLEGIDNISNHEVDELVGVSEGRTTARFGSKGGTSAVDDAGPDLIASGKRVLSTGANDVNDVLVLTVRAMGNLLHFGYDVVRVTHRTLSDFMSALRLHSGFTTMVTANTRLPADFMEEMVQVHFVSYLKKFGLDDSYPAGAIFGPPSKKLDKKINRALERDGSLSRQEADPRNLQIDQIRHLTDNFQFLADSDKAALAEIGRVMVEGGTVSNNTLTQIRRSSNDIRQRFPTSAPSTPVAAVGRTEASFEVDIHSETVILDRNVHSAMAAVREDPDAFASLPANEQAWFAAAAQHDVDLRSANLDYRTGPTVIAENPVPNRTIGIGADEISFTRTHGPGDPEYDSLLEKLRFYGVGSVAGAKDQHMVADAFFGARPGGVIPTLITADGPVAHGLLRASGATTPNPNELFTVTIDGRTIKVIFLK